MTATHRFEPTTAEAFDALLQAPEGKLVVAYFWGTHCPNCEVFAADAPELLHALPELPVKLVKVDAYSNPALATRYGLFGIPAFLFFRSGRLIGKMSRYYGREEWLRVMGEQMERAQAPLGLSPE